ETGCFALTPPKSLTFNDCFDVSLRSRDTGGTSTGCVLGILRRISLRTLRAGSFVPCLGSSQHEFATIHERRKEMLVVSVQTIDQAISLLQRMRTGAAKPTKGFNISSATAREIKEVADCYMAVK